MKWSTASLPAAVLIAGGCETSILVQTEPSHADVALARSNVNGVSDVQFHVPDRIFGDGPVQEERLRLSKEGYHELEVPVSIRRGRANQLSPPVYRLEPIVTTIEILTEPEEASVEDMSSGGFGYLGQTPLTFEFSWEDVSKWAEVVEVRRGGHKFIAVQLDLRIDRPGYGTEVLEDLLVPIGEERSFKRTLRREGQITFTSEPYGVTVYVVRHNNGVEYLQRMGTTPFPYTREDGLTHGESLYWEKTGFVTERTPYVQGNQAFHAVLTPDD